MGDYDLLLGTTDENVPALFETKTVLDFKYSIDDLQFLWLHIFLFKNNGAYLQDFSPNESWKVNGLLRNMNMRYHVQKEGNGYNSGHLSSACFFVDEQKDMQKMKRECIWR